MRRSVVQPRTLSQASRSERDCSELLQQASHDDAQQPTGKYIAIQVHNADLQVEQMHCRVTADEDLI